MQVSHRNARKHCASDAQKPLVRADEKEVGDIGPAIPTLGRSPVDGPV